MGFGWERFGYLVQDDPAAKLQAESLAGPGLRSVSLARMTDFDWGHAVFLGPYTSQEAATKALGFELLHSDLRTAGIPIIMITSRTAEKHRQYALDLGVRVYLGKPYSERDLVTHIAHCTERRAA